MPRAAVRPRPGAATGTRSTRRRSTRPRTAGTTLEGWLRIWDRATGVLHSKGQGHGGLPIYAVTFAPDSKRLYTAGGDLAVRTWDPDGHALASRDDPDEPVALDVDP